MSNDNNPRQPVPTVRTPSMDEIHALQAAARHARNIAIITMFQNRFTEIVRAVDKALDWLSRPREPSLMDLDDRMLKDIGLTRSDALTAAKRRPTALPANSNRPQRIA
ncbi:MAG: DUF1127 domain-containing protein [Alphaproteobacteria bacterium]|nr:DUF1127 domain-containing protein [Alphaproteobacteria bacterium]